MKRGLKAELPMTRVVRLFRVATYAPMKRGLKGTSTAHWQRIAPSSNLCPDEEGTESRIHHLRPRRPDGVATYAPMKRGLKVKLC